MFWKANGFYFYFFPLSLCWMFLSHVEVKLYVNCILRGLLPDRGSQTQMISVFLSIMSGLGELVPAPPVQDWRVLSSSPLSKHCATCVWSPKCFLIFRWGKSLFILVSSHVALENRQCSALHSATIAISFFFPPSQQFQPGVRNTWCPQSLFMFSLTRPLGSVRSILWDSVSASSCVLWWEVHITQIFVGFIVLA